MLLTQDRVRNRLEVAFWYRFKRCITQWYLDALWVTMHHLQPPFSLSMNHELLPVALRHWHEEDIARHCDSTATILEVCRDAPNEESFVGFLVVGRSLVEGRGKHHLLLPLVPYESLEGVPEVFGDPIDIGAIVSPLAIGGGFDFDLDSALTSVDGDVSTVVLTLTPPSEAGVTNLPTAHVRVVSHSFLHDDGCC